MHEEALNSIPKLIPRLKCLSLFGRELVRELGILLLRRQRRTSQLVSVEYDQIAWKKFIDQSPWKQFSSMDEYVFTQAKAGNITAILDGAWVRVDRREYYKQRNFKIASIINKFAKSDQAIVELGCGPGMNIIWLASQSPEREFIGLDISKNALIAAQQTAKHFGIKNVRFELLDFLDTHQENWKLILGKLVFTYVAIEQVGRATSKVIENIREAQPDTVIHFENSYEDFDLKNLNDWLTKIYIFRKDYVRDLKQELNRFNSKNKIRVLDSFRFAYSPQIKNDLQVRVWSPLH